MADSERYDTHPVWQIYKELRTARLNVKYFSIKVSRLERINLIIQIIIAAAVPSSAIANLPFWGSGAGSSIWSIIGIVAALLAFAHPFFKITQNIKKLDNILVGYIGLETDLETIKNDIRITQNFTQTHIREFKKAVARKKKLSTDERGHTEDKKLINKLFIEVKQELPSSSFYVPEDKNGKR